MEQRIGRRKYSIYAFDIESHNDYKSLKRMETSMWLGCLINEKSNVRDSSSYVYNMDEFLNRIHELSTAKRHSSKEKRPVKNIAIFIYNLSFEWSFILPYLYKYGFKFKEKIEEGDSYVFNSVSTKSVSSVWSATIKFDKNAGVINFRDLAKIYGGSLGKVAKAFNLETQKGSINYRKNRLSPNYRITAKEKIYCFKDTRIIIDILLKIIENGDKDFWNAISMASYSMKKLLKTGFPRATRPYLEYRKQYPELDQEETDFLRAGVEGGITYAPSRWQFKEINQKILHIDAHQMHPTQGYLKCFPYGKGEYFTGKPKMTFTGISCVRIRISYNYVKLHSIIKLIGLDTIEDKVITVWDFEIPTMYKVYEGLTVEYIDGYMYKSKPLPWRNYYKDNYFKRLEAKRNNDAFNTLQFKLLNNSSYGKHLEKPHNEIIENMVRADGIIDSYITPKTGEDVQVNARYTYLPVGSAIPAYSRVQLIETALLFNWQDILYFDTDSIFVLATEHNMNVWEKQIDHTDFLGGWALEEICERAQFTAPKRYKLLVNGKSIVKMAGINGVNDVPFDEINIVNSTWKVQRAFRCKGGTLIDFQTKQISVQKKYQIIYDRNSDIEENNY